MNHFDELSAPTFTWTQGSVPFDSTSEKSADAAPHSRDFLMSAKIDYLTIRTENKVGLPLLDGHAIWPRGSNGKKLSIHDPSARDVSALVLAFPEAELTELEIAVDFRPRPGIPAAQQAAILKTKMRAIAFQLEPSDGPGMENTFRAFYKRVGPRAVTAPFNLFVPRNFDELLYGGRDDKAQVKAYLKKTDQGKALKATDHVARIEVRLSGALPSHGLPLLSSLPEFRFRVSLAPYFRMILGTKRNLRGRKLTGPLRQTMNDYFDVHDKALWARSGVGNFLPGGRGAEERVRLLRDQALNDRVGQALQRLERKFSLTKSVCFPALGTPANPVLAHPAG